MRIDKRRTEIASAACWVPFNQSWARNAGAMIVVLSDTLTAGDGASKPSYSCSFDAGAAWGYLALEAHRLGLYTHAMTAVDFDAARATLNEPERFWIECVIAVSRIGDRRTCQRIALAENAERRPAA